MTDQTGPSLLGKKLRVYTAFGLIMTALLGGYYTAVRWGVAHDTKLLEEKNRQTPERLQTVARESLTARGFTDTTYTSHTLGMSRASVYTTTKKDGITYEAASSCNSAGCYKPVLQPLYSEPVATAATNLLRENGYAVAEWGKMKLNHDASKGRVEATVVKDGRSFNTLVGCEQDRCLVISMKAM